jgi:hypothetical protein
MAGLQMNKRNVDAMASEANGTLSREVITLPQDAAIYEAGTALQEVHTAPTRYVDGDGNNLNGILCYPVDATAGAVEAVAWVRLCEIDIGSVIWPAGMTVAEQNAAMAAAEDYIVFRTSLRPQADT